MKTINPSINEQFKTTVNVVLKFSPLMTIHAVMKRVVSLWRLFYAKEFSRIAQENEILDRTRARTVAKIEKLQRQLDSDEIPLYLSGKTSFAPPCGFWGRLVFFILLAVALTTAVLEAVNFAWYLRFFTQSFLLGLAFAIPVFCVAVAEGAYLLIMKASEPTRKVVASAVALLVLLSGVGYVVCSLASSDGSMASVFADQAASFSLDSWRMAFQMGASIGISTLCLHAAFSLGSLTPTLSPLRAEREAELKALHDDLDRLDRALGESRGDQGEIEAIKDDTILSCSEKHEQLQALREEIEKVLKEPL